MFFANLSNGAVNLICIPPAPPPPPSLFAFSAFLHWIEPQKREMDLAIVQRDWNNELIRRDMAGTFWTHSRCWLLGKTEEIDDVPHIG